MDSGAISTKSQGAGDSVNVECSQLEILVTSLAVVAAAIPDEKCLFQRPGCDTPTSLSFMPGISCQLGFSTGAILSQLKGT